MNAMLCRAPLSALLLIAALTPAPAQDWPSRNVTVIVPVPAGVTSDIVARVVFEQVGKQVGHTFVVENRPGAGGSIGGNVVAKAAPDGHTILVWGSITAANALYTKLPYDTLNDFTPVAMLGQTPLVVVTGAGRYKSIGELIAAAKANPGKLNYSSVGIGSAAHFGAEQLAVSEGISVQHVPFKSGEWLTEVMAGRVDFAVTPVTSAIGLIRDGKIVPLAISSSKPSPSLPNVPTMVQAGLKPGAAYPFYTGAYLPAKTPHAIAVKLHDEVMKALALPAVQQRLAAVGVEPMPMTLAEFDAFFKKDIAANLELVKTAKIPKQ
ncbi:MAG TPA: tripartite tricarboxylate transporter substrate-binding protein [Pseudolabrys sp.]|nr:tripartite tricarboxylate transporter substrate-binding protein [Pseudolabrys sp.]